MYVYVNGALQCSSGYSGEYLMFEGHLDKGWNSVTIRFWENGGGEYMAVGICRRGTSAHLGDLSYSLEPPFLVKDAQTGDFKKLTSGSVQAAYLPKVKGVTHYQIVQSNFFEDAEPDAAGWLAYEPGAIPAGNLPCALTAQDDKVYYTYFLRKEDGTVVKHSTTSLETGVRIGNVGAVGATAATVGNGVYTLSFSASGNIHFARPTTVDVLLVGGGGGGGTLLGGGGGGGSVVYRQNVLVPAGTYNIVVGEGGDGASWDGTVASANGGSSTFLDLEAPGGGAGGGSSYTGNGFYDGRNSGLAGASGGGASGHRKLNNEDAVPGDGLAGYGYAGGSAIVHAGNNIKNDNGAGGGGGGAGAAGGDAHQPDPENNSDIQGGAGGNGTVCAITGSDVTYGGGGGGGSNYYGGENVSASGGEGGGGRGGWLNSGTNNAESGTDGTDGLGGGGGGGGLAWGFYNHESHAHGGKGGDGIVVIRFTPEYGENSDPGRGGVMTKKDGWMIHKFTENGKFSLPSSVVGQVLLVGGGGGGGNGYGAAGGGGGGGMLVLDSAEILAGNYEVIVGAGGLGGIRGRECGNKGEDSVFAEWRAIGGGGGAGIFKDNGMFDGGSGGGAYNTDQWKHEEVGGSGIEGQGYAGGTNTYKQDRSDSFGAGGGGAGAVGGSATVDRPGKGGDGRMCDYSGEEVWYAGGGGGGGSGNVDFGLYGEGGKGGGGHGGWWTQNPDGLPREIGDTYATVGDGVDGLGGGGGGGTVRGGNWFQGPGGNGGSGIVIIRYRLRPNATVVMFR